MCIFRKITKPTQQPQLTQLNKINSKLKNKILHTDKVVKKLKNKISDMKQTKKTCYPQSSC